MAISTRELFLIVRAQNQASGAIRRVGADLQALARSTAHDTQIRRRQLQDTLATTRAQRTLAQDRLRSLETGTRAMSKETVAAERNLSLHKQTLRELQAEGRQIELNKAELQRQANVARQTYFSRNPRIPAPLRTAAKLQLSALAEQEKQLAIQQAELNARISQGVAVTEKEALAFKRATVALEEHQAALARAAEQVQRYTNREITATARLREFEREQARLRWEPWQRGAQAVSHFGRVLQLTGLVVAASFALMGHAAANFTTEATLAGTQAGFSPTEVARKSQLIQKETLQQMHMFPAASQEVTKSFYDIYSSMTVTDTQANRLLNSFQKTSVAGLAPLNDVVNAGITLMNNFGGSINNPDKMMNQLLATVRFGRLTVQQYTATLNQLVPAFANAGQSSLQMNAALATVTRLMPSQRMGATGLARLTEMFNNPAFITGVRQFGIQVTDSTGRLLPFNKIIEQIAKSSDPFVKGLQTGKTSAIEFFKTLTNSQGTIQGRRVFINLVRNSALLDAQLKAIGSDTGELNRSFSQLRQSPGVEWQVVVNEFKALAIEIGYGVIPVVQKMFHALAPLFNWINGLSKGTKEWIGGIGLAAGALTLLSGIVLSVVGTLTSMALEIAVLVAGRGSLLALEAGFASAGVALRFTLIGAIILALPLIIRYHSKIMGLIDALGGLKHILVLLAVTIGTVRFIGMIQGMDAAAASAGIATSSMSLLIARLKLLASIGTIVIAVDVLEKFIPSKERKRGQQVLNQGGGGPLGKIPLLGAMFQEGAYTGRKVGNWLHLGGMMGYTDDGGYRQGSAEDKAFLAGEANRAYDLGKLSDPKIMEAYKRGRQAGHHKIPDTGPFSIVDPAAVKRGVDNVKKNIDLAQRVVAKASADTTWSDLYNTAARARQALSTAPDHKHWLAYYTALEALSKRSSKVQMAAARATLNQIKIDKAAVPVDNAVLLQQIAHVKELFKAASKHPSLAAWEAYHAALDKLNKMGTASQQAAAQDMLNATESSTKKAVNRHAAAVKKMAADAKQSLDTISGTLQSTFDNFQQSNQSAFGTLFQGPVATGARMQVYQQWGGKMTGRDLLADLRAQLSKFRQFRRVLNQLSARGAPFDLVDQIRQAGPDALDEARALLSLDKKEFNQYTSVFRQAQTRIAAATGRDMQNQLGHWRSFGSKIMLAILKGMDEHSARFETYFKNLAITLFPDLAKKGGVKLAPASASPMRPNASTLTGAASRDKAYTEYHYHGGTMDYSTWLRKSKHHFKNTYGKGHN